MESPEVSAGIVGSTELEEHELEMTSPASKKSKPKSNLKAKTKSKAKAKPSAKPSKAVNVNTKRLRGPERPNKLAKGKLKAVNVAKSRVERAAGKSNRGRSVALKAVDKQNELVVVKQPRWKAQMLAEIPNGINDLQQISMWIKAGLSALYRKQATLKGVTVTMLIRTALEKFAIDGFPLDGVPIEEMIEQEKLAQRSAARAVNAKAKTKVKAKVKAKVK